jgi:hypothetical protein
MSAALGNKIRSLATRGSGAGGGGGGRRRTLCDHASSTAENDGSEPAESDEDLVHRLTREVRERALAFGSPPREVFFSHAPVPFLCLGLTAERPCCAFR